VVTTDWPTDYDPRREPFAEPGIDPRIMGRALDPTTGEIAPPPGRPYQPDTSRTAWPPRSRGPLPPREAIPPDLNIGTAQDEVDAWAHEHDHVTNELARVRVLLAGDPDDPDAPSLERRLILARAQARREARRNPNERGRRTDSDITAEVEEALERDGVLGQHRALTAYQDTLTGRLFRAKDNIARLDSYIRSLPRVDAGRG